MADLTDIQSSQSVKLAGVDPILGTETNWALVDLFGSQAFTVRDAAGAMLLGQKAMALSLPVTMASDQTPLIVAPSPPVDRKVNGTIVALNGVVEISCEGLSSVIMSISGTWAAALVVEGTVDGTNWYGVTFISLATNSQVLSINSNGLYQVPTAGYLKIRLRASLFESGTVTVYLEGNQGQFSVFSLQSSQGFNSDFDFGDVTTAAQTKALVYRTPLIEQTTNARRSIASSSALDTAAGTGARTVQITYFDQTGGGPFFETITLNGTAYVNTVNTNICFVEHIKVVTVGSTGQNAGIITLKAATAGGGATIMTVAATDKQTFLALHYVPIGRVCRVTGISCSHNGTTVGSGAVFVLGVQPIGLADQVETQASDFIRLYGQSSTFSRVYQSPIDVTGPARIRMYVTPETSSSTVYRASFDFFE